VYRRDTSVHHIEYATTLKCPGLGDLSSPDARTRAAAMGILFPARLTRPIALQPPAPLRTVITLGCFRRAEPATEGIFTIFFLLLTEVPVEEPDVIDLGTIYERRYCCQRRRQRSTGMTACTSQLLTRTSFTWRSASTPSAGPLAKVCVLSAAQTSTPEAAPAAKNHHRSPRTSNHEHL
jgi:hypothetical protein